MLELSPPLPVLLLLRVGGLSRLSTRAVCVYVYKRRDIVRTELMVQRCLVRIEVHRSNDLSNCHRDRTGESRNIRELIGQRHVTIPLCLHAQREKLPIHATDEHLKRFVSVSDRHANTKHISVIRGKVHVDNYTACQEGMGRGEKWSYSSLYS
jgi:hypothetical protein